MLCQQKNSSLLYFSVSTKYGGNTFEHKLRWLLCSFSSHNIAKGLLILSIKVFCGYTQIRHAQCLVKYCIIVQSFFVGQQGLDCGLR